MKPTIITLAPDVQIEGVSFEEAFGEHSEARGKKRTERVKARQAAKRERIAARAETKVAKQEAKKAKKEARISRRQAAQQARMGKRQAAMEARQARRTTRKTLREERRAIGEEQEPLNQDGIVMGEAPMMPTPQMEMPQQEPQGFNEEPMVETSEPQAGEGGYAPQPTYMTPPQRGTEYQEEVGMYGESDTETGEEPLGDNSEYTDDESSFDAETSGEENSFDQENSEFLGKQNALDNRIAVLNDKIRLHESQAENLKTALRNGKLPSNRLASGAKELKARAIHLDSLRKKLAMAQEAKRKQGIVPVPASLDPKIEKNRIVIPASSADGEESYIFEDEMSSFDGKNFWNKNKGIIMGLGVAAIAIYALNKYKVFK